MNSKERHEFYSTNLSDFYKTTTDELIRELVNKLIEALYIPVKGYDGISQVDQFRIDAFGIDGNEPINWGDLKCNEVKKFEDGSFLVVIDEAAPSDCPSFCEYIERYMHSYGWDVRVETEW